MASTLELDRDRIRELFDLRRRGEHGRGTAVYSEDPYPTWHRLREEAPVHEGSPHALLGWDGTPLSAAYLSPDLRHVTLFDWDTCDRAFRDEEAFPSGPKPVDPNAGEGLGSSMLYIRGPQHRRYRALAQPSFVPRKAEWWIAQWIRTTVDALIDGFIADGKAELNVDFDAAIPVLTITGSFGLPVEDALTIRENLGLSMGGDHQVLASYLLPIIEARRAEPADDLITVLCQAEITDPDGARHRLTDAEIFSFSHLLLAAGSGTTWKQIGITLAALLTHPEVLAAVTADRSLLRAAIEESMRWCPNDPVFTRWAATDVELAGTTIAGGTMVHVCLGAANRDPLRWERPDEFDITRPLQANLGFGGGPHVCIGQHVARAEMFTAIDALLTRLPNLRLDPDAEQPAIIGLYERGPTELNVLWG